MGGTDDDGGSGAATDDAGGEAAAERHLVVDGRRWRRSDPSIPEGLRAELVAELMAARRAIGAGDRTPAARARVHDAKVALGERGRPWWEPSTADDRRARTTAAVRSLLRARAGGAVRPSDAARVVAGDRWRSALPDVRAAAGAMVAGGELEALRGGQPVDPVEARGPVRYRLPR